MTAISKQTCDRIDKLIRDGGQLLAELRVQEEFGCIVSETEARRIRYLLEDIGNKVEDMSK